MSLHSQNAPTGVTHADAVPRNGKSPHTPSSPRPNLASPASLTLTSLHIINRVNPLSSYCVSIPSSARVDSTSSRACGLVNCQLAAVSCGSWKPRRLVTKLGLLTEGSSVEYFLGTALLIITAGRSKAQANQCYQDVSKVKLDCWLSLGGGGQSSAIPGMATSKRLAGLTVSIINTENPPENNQFFRLRCESSDHHCRRNRQHVAGAFSIQRHLLCMS